MEAIPTAVRHIWDLPLPPGVPLGPFYQEMPVDRFFADFGAYRRFNELTELEDWINNKLDKGSSKIGWHCRGSGFTYAIAILLSSTSEWASESPF